MSKEDGEGTILRQYTFYNAQDVDDTVARLNSKIRELESSIESLQSMRPHWAKGYTSDSMAAQGQTAALSQIWSYLGVDNQTDAMQKLRELNKEN
ncbi:hypothetical protein V19_55 [Brucella phage V_19]|uniref:Uncharacterized protein n=30 Tax=Perisivirus TaxID=1984798 RepID=H2EI92_9CAUD|nr:hypothetical protein [Brucella melitensis]YP_007002063.1 hypothetical protein F354_gp55 [Brucella phage Tb]YP_007002120.1 hypothetical protein F355_gp54 [Brucella phage Pr]AHB81113.1 hypothetical protein Bk_54 [Brucella phage Bk]AHB81171.1 hypothetical protein Fz_55 [Brucella phage Fz]AHB81227.1 hypothetical protein R/C_54 [Brucella phage R/C]AHB81283.1 hypothetical protein S708_54 [Brucella phage S708]AHB81397.1 hypothetical protein Wb_54 [Brucella phage Wb]AKO59043.1 hypothetical prote